MRALLLVAAMSLAGCASKVVSDADMHRLNYAMSTGKCDDAVSIVSKTNDPVKYNNLGVVAENCEKNMAKARSYYEYGARLGVKTSIDNLLRNGWPVPSPDIKQANDASREAGIANGLMLLQAGQPKPQPMLQNNNINCTTRNVAGTLQTSCW